MGWLVGTIILWILGGIAVIFAVLSPAEVPATDTFGRPVEGAPPTKNWWRVSAFAFAGLMVFAWLALTAASSIKIVDAGHVGVIKTFGAIDGQVGDGPTAIAPWSDLIDVSTKATRKEFDHLAAFSKETQDVFVDATLNLAVAPDDVQCLYRTVGSDWYDKLIPPRVLQTLKDETVKYSTVDVAPHREDIRTAVKKRLQDQLAAFSVRAGACKVAIDVQDFLLRNIDFRPEFKQAIEQKQIATQDAQTARNRVAQSQYQAEQQVARAHGEANATLVKAQAQAKANRLVSASLTPEIIQYAYVQRLAPNVQAIVPAGSNLVVPASIFGK
jgi:regulator of protease activity HflC (stomatin/prohibitin superfamily)